MKRVSQDSKAAFKKFKLVPADEYEKPAQPKIQHVEKLIRNYNPTLRGMVNSYSGMNPAAKGKRSGLTAKERLNLLNSNRARFLHLQNSAFHTDDVASQQQNLEELKDARTTADQVADFAELPFPEPEALDTKFKFEPADSKPTLIGTSSTSKGVSRRSRDKLTLLKDLIGNVIKPNRLGELMINNKTIRSTSYDKVMRSLFVDDNDEVPGLSQAVKELKRIGIPVEMLSSNRARNLFELVNPKQQGFGRLMGKMKQCSRKSCKVLRMY
jgi:hypothetical protein